MERKFTFCILIFSTFFLSSCFESFDDFKTSSFGDSEIKSKAVKNGLKIELDPQDEKTLDVSGSESNQVSFIYKNYFPQDKFPNGIDLNYKLSGFVGFFESGDKGVVNLNKFKPKVGENNFVDGQFIISDIEVSDRINDESANLKFDYCYNSKAYILGNICTTSENCKGSVTEFIGSNDFSYGYEISENSNGNIEVIIEINLKADPKSIVNTCDFGKNNKGVSINPSFLIANKNIDCDLESGYSNIIENSGVQLRYNCGDIGYKFNDGEVIPIYIETSYNKLESFDINFDLIKRNTQLRNSGTIE